MPLLITLDKLLTHGYLDELLVMESGQFVDDLLTNLLDEVRGCTDVKRLLAIAGVTINLLQPDLQTIGLVRKNPDIRGIANCAFFFLTLWLCLCITPATRKVAPVDNDHATKSISSCTQVCRRAAFRQVVC